VPLVRAGPNGWKSDDVLAMIRARPGVVHYLGRVTVDDLRCLYAAAGVLALPSIHEGFGLPMLEAMHSGCPVVASTGGALPEIAGDAAVLVDPLDVGAWADAIARVLQDSSLRTAMRTKGLARARAFSWRSTAQATLQLYRQLA
jgi:alpha-1,3-rhamnosyl/mannosyltransferase